MTIDIPKSLKLFHARKANAIAKRRANKEYKRTGNNLLLTFKSALGHIKSENPGREWCSLREVQNLMVGA